jgi:hypothetical protein
MSQARLPATPTIIVVSLVLAAVTVDRARSQGLEPSVQDVTAGIAAYVRQFSERFATLVGDEQYSQTSNRVTDRGSGIPGVPSRRRIQSEVLLVWLPSERSWLTARNVRRVDGKPVADSARRLDQLLAEPTTDWPARVRQLRDEGARFNIGRLERNFSDPNTVLQLLGAESQQRFEFTVRDYEPVGQTAAWRVAFTEKGTPSVIQINGRDVQTMGEVWIADADYAILRSRLTIKDVHFTLRSTVAIDVSYRFDERLATWVPEEMREVYEQRGQGAYKGRLTLFDDRIEGTANYTNFRRFETAGRLVGR